MNWLPTRLVLCGLILCFEIFVVWMFTKPANVVTQTLPIESQPLTAIVSEPPSVSTPQLIENGKNDVAKTRIEQFSDDKRIGRRGRNKIEIECFSLGDERFAEIKFYTRSEYGSWIEKQSFKFDKDGVSDCDPVIEDFNSDRFRDFTYQSAVAARGANEVRKLFIYDSKNDELVYITNSEEYPNLLYNKKLNCVDSFRVTGTTETEFLHIEGDKLREFASVNNGLEREVTITDEAGNRKTLRRQKYDVNDFGEAFRRFSSYDPPR